MLKSALSQTEFFTTLKKFALGLRLRGASEKAQLFSRRRKQAIAPRSAVMFASYGFTTYKRRTVIMLLFPYLPFEDAEDGYLPLDAYYIYSHKAHLETLEFIGALQKKGIEAREFTEPVFKRLAIDSGVAAIWGTNSLVYSYSLGSRFVLSAVEISYKMSDAERDFEKIMGDFKAERSVAGKKTQTINCYKCGECIRACPMGAIDYNGVNTKRCMRTYMTTGNIPDDESSELMGNKFMGCDICQAVCPMNKRASRKIPDELKQLLKISDFLQDPKGQTFKLSPFIGVNYANPNRLLSLCINAAGNSGNKEYIPLIERHLNTQSATVKKAAERALKKLGGAVFSDIKPEKI